MCSSFPLKPEYNAIVKYTPSDMPHVTYTRWHRALGLVFNLVHMCKLQLMRVLCECLCFRTKGSKICLRVLDMLHRESNDMFKLTVARRIHMI